MERRSKYALPKCFLVKLSNNCCVAVLPLRRIERLSEYVIPKCFLVKGFLVKQFELIYLLQFCQLRRNQMACVKRIWYLSPMRAAKVQASLRIRAVSPELPLLAQTSIESRGTFRQKARSLAPLNGWACAVKICHDGMLEDTNSLDGARLITVKLLKVETPQILKFEQCGF